MKFFAVKRKFRTILKPYDVVDVIEQYTSGHVELVSQIKTMATRLDKIIGRRRRSRYKGDFEDEGESIASRIIKVERQVHYLE